MSIAFEHIGCIGPAEVVGNPIQALELGVTCSLAIISTPTSTTTKTAALGGPLPGPSVAQRTVTHIRHRRRIRMQREQVTAQRYAIDTEIQELETRLLSLRRSRNKLAPVASLPTDVLSTIFSILAEDYRTASDLEKALWVSWACSFWRQTALETPDMWQKVPLLRHPDWVRACLSRTRKNSLHGHAHVEGSTKWGGEEGFVILGANFDRFKSLSCSSINDMTTWDLGDALSTSSSSLEVLSLESLRLHEVDLRVCPRLRVLSLRTCEVPLLLPSSLTSLKIVRPSGQLIKIDAFFSALCACPNLEELATEHAFATPDDSAAVVSSPLLPKLRTLHLDDEDDLAAWEFGKKLKLPSLSFVRTPTLGGSCDIVARDLRTATGHSTVLWAPAYLKIYITSDHASVEFGGDGGNVRIYCSEDPPPIDHLWRVCKLLALDELDDLDLNIQKTFSWPSLLAKSKKVTSLSVHGAAAAAYLQLVHDEAQARPSVVGQAPQELHPQFTYPRLQKLTIHDLRIGNQASIPKFPTSYDSALNQRAQVLGPLKYLIFTGRAIKHEVGAGKDLTNCAVEVVNQATFW